MSGIHNQERLEEVRRRLYERGKPAPQIINHGVEHDVTPVRTQWLEPPKPIVPVPKPVPPPSTYPQSTLAEELHMSPVTKKKRYRTKILLAGFAFFMIAVVVSSLFIILGKGSISGENIALTATGPFTIGGGQELQVQVGITNSNSVPIESATLIVEYPKGTLSATETGKDLFTERLPLQTINSGETVNVPLRANVFGEENEEKTVKVSIEYRVQGSNATFFKEADPLRFKISSSPVVLRVDGVQKIASGQESTITLSVVSNSPAPLSEVLVKADYPPTAFDFSKAVPAPTHGENIWLIKNLEPQKEQKIVITGVVIGKETDKNGITFSVGVPNESNPEVLASIFATAKTDFEIEQPFLDIAMKINSLEDQVVAIEPGKRSSVSIELSNTLSDTLYDMTVEVALSGNAFAVEEVSPSGGYFDPVKNTISWDVSNTDALKQATPGEKERLAFTIEPSSKTGATPQVDITVNAKARRVSEQNVSEQLVGTAKRSIKVISMPSLAGVVSHNNGIFPDTGPVPPQSDKTTTYTVSLVIDNGTNEISDTTVNATLPAYVTWLNKTTGAGTITYNTVTREITWNAGGVPANGQTYASFQVGVLPRVLQVGTTPNVLGEQRLKATDKFTGVTVRDTSPAITTMLHAESGGDEKSGIVVGAQAGN